MGIRLVEVQGIPMDVVQQEGFAVSPSGDLVTPEVQVTFPRLQEVSPEETPPDLAIRTPYSGVAAGVRETLQGASLGTADEIEAALRSAFSDEDYKTIRDRIRAQQEQFKSDYPKTSLGLDIAGGLAVPAGILGSAYKAGKGAWQMAKTGAAAGAGAGAITGAGVAPEMSDIPASAATYAATGGVLGGVAPSVIGFSGKIIKSLIDSTGLTNANKVATRKLSEFFDMDNLNPKQVQDMLDEYRRIGVPDPVIADITNNLRGLGYQSYIIPSKSKDAVESFLDSRNADLAMSLSRGLEQKAGVKSQGKFGFDYIDDLARSQETAAKNAYPKAYTQDIPAAPFRKYVDRDIFAKAYDEAKRRADVYGQTLPELSQIRNAQFISTQIMHDIKRGLDDVIERETDKVTGKMSSYGADVAKVKKEFNDLIKYYNKDYAQANAKFADFAKLKEAYNDGLDFLKIESSELVAKLKNMTPAEKESFRVGMISDIRNKLANFKGGDPSRLVFKSDRQKQSLKYAFDDEAQFKDFVRQVDYQNNLLKTQRKVLGGSRTHENAVTSIEDLNTAGKVVRGDFLGAVGDIFKRGYARASGMTPEVSETMKKMMFTPSPYRQKEILDIIGNMNKPSTNPLANAVGGLANPAAYGGLLGEQSALIGK